MIRRRIARITRQPRFGFPLALVACAATVVSNVPELIIPGAVTTWWLFERSYTYWLTVHKGKELMYEYDVKYGRSPKEAAEIHGLKLGEEIKSVPYSREVQDKNRCSLHEYQRKHIKG